MTKYSATSFAICMKLVNQNKNSNPVTTDIQDFSINVAMNIHNLVANVSMETLGAAQHEI